MKYIIENALSYEYGTVQHRSLLIDHSKVISVNSHFSHYTYMRLFADDYIIAPGHVMIDSSVVTISNFNSFKERMKHLHSIGCTTLISICAIQYESQLEIKLKKTKHALINSSIDFVVGIQIPLNKLSPTLVRKCCNYKIPIIFAEINRVEDIYSIQWQQIRDQLFPYHIVIVPIWKVDSSHSKLVKLKKEWYEILTVNKISTVSDSLNEHEPLSKIVLMSIGLYPQKGSLQAGADADYLLFHKDKLADGEQDLLQLRPEVVYANGNVKKAGKQLYLKPGTGKEVGITLPRKMMIIQNALGPLPISIDYY